jgi:hypothetical protein
LSGISLSPPAVLPLNRESLRKRRKNTDLLVHTMGAAGVEELEITEGVNNQM